MSRIILIFASTTEVLQAEDILDEQDLDFELVPVPKEVNPNCGLAISFSPTERDVVLAALKESDLKPIAAYERNGEEFLPHEALQL